MTMRPLTRPRAHLLNHAELVYGPGDRPLARRLLEALGFRVVDPRTDPVPESLGPAAAPYLIVYLDRDDDDPIDNVLYVSEMSVEQAEFEALLRDRMADDEALGARLRALVEAFVERPQAMPHLGIAYADADGVRSALARVAGDPALAGRVRVSPSSSRVCPAPSTIGSSRASCIPTCSRRASSARVSRSSSRSDSTAADAPRPAGPKRIGILSA
ncbi:MAG: hypothetical protein R3E53_08270 [Myxococcota bacterium]